MRRQKLRKERLPWKCLSSVSYFSRSHVIYFQQTATIRGFVWHDLCWWSDPGVPWWRSRPRQSHVYGSGLGGLLYSLCMSFLICRWRYLTVRFDQNLQYIFLTVSSSPCCHSVAYYTLVWPVDTHRLAHTFPWAHTWCLRSSWKGVGGCGGIMLRYSYSKVSYLYVFVMFIVPLSKGYLSWSMFILSS